MLTLHVDHELTIMIITQGSRDQGPPSQILYFTIMGAKEPWQVFPQHLDALVKSDKNHCSEIVTWSPTPNHKESQEVQSYHMPRRGKKWKYLLKTLAAITDGESLNGFIQKWHLARFLFYTVLSGRNQRKYL